MTSNRSFFNARLLRETMKRNVWAAALSLIGFFFCMPLPVAMIVQSMNEGYSDKEIAMQHAAGNVADILSGNNPLTKIGICIMAVLCGVALFRYLHARRQVDFYHALPIGRSALFVNNYVAGVLTVLPALVIMYALAGVFAGAMGVSGALHAGLIGRALLTHLLFFLLIYTVTVLATILTGNTILAVLLDGWLLFSLPAAAVVLSSLCNMYLQTWAESSLLGRVMQYTSPVLLYITPGANGSGSSSVLAAVFVLWLALTALALALFRCRKSERAGTAIAFGGFKPPLKWYMVLLLALLFGMVFYSIGGEFWIWFGLLAGTVLGHILIEIIYHFDLRAAFAHWKTMIVLAVAAVAIVGGIQRDVMGYDTWLPKEDNIKAVGLSTAIFEGYEEDVGINPYLNTSIDAGPVLTDPEVIRSVRALAQTGVEQLGEPEGNTCWLHVTYDLGGRTAARQYELPLDNTVLELFTKIRFSEDYIRHAAPAYQVDLGQKQIAETLSLSVRTNANASDTIASVISDPAQASEILAALQEETLTLTPEQAASTVPVLRMDASYVVGPDTQNIVQYIPVYPTYTRTLALLGRYGGVQPKALTVADLSRIEVSWNAYDAPERYEATEGDGATQQDVSYHQGEGTVSVTDPAQMEALLQNAVLEPVAQSCDMSFPLVYDEVYTVSAVFRNNRSCILYYRAGAFPVQLCASIRQGQPR